MSIKIEVAVISNQQHQRENEYLITLKTVEARIKNLASDYKEHNYIDPLEVKAIAEWAAEMYAQAQSAADLRELVERLTK
jgi:hypothetical protein